MTDKFGPLYLAAAVKEDVMDIPTLDGRPLLYAERADCEKAMLDAGGPAGFRVIEVYLETGGTCRTCFFWDDKEAMMERRACLAPVLCCQESVEAAIPRPALRMPVGSTTTPTMFTGPAWYCPAWKPKARS